MNKFLKTASLMKLVSFAALLVCFGTFAWAAGGGGEHGEQVAKWHSIDTYKVLNFGLLVAVLFLLAKKPVKEFFQSRRKGIEDELTDLEKKKKNAEKELAEYESRLKNLNEESNRILDDYVRQGEEAKRRIIAEAQEQATKLEELAKRNIEQEFKAAKTALKNEIVEKAVAEAETLVKQSIASEDQDRLVDEYLKKVVA